MLSCSIVLMRVRIRHALRYARPGAKVALSRSDPSAEDLRTSRRRMRICLVYDCLFPYTVGGAERWYRNLAERLAAEGHEVTYLTLRQWERGSRPGRDGRRRAGGRPADGALRRAGRRRILPPLVFGAGVLGHLLRHGRRYDVVHTCSFPYFSLLAAAVAPAPWRLSAGRRLVRGVDSRLLARVSGPVRRRRRLARSAAVRARPAAGVLLLAAARPSPARRGPEGESRCSRGPTTGPLEAAAGPRGRAAGRVRRPPHSREAGARDRYRRSRARGSACPSSGRRSSETAPSVELVRAAVEHSGSQMWSRLPVLSPPRRSRRVDRRRAVPAAALAPRGLWPRHHRGSRAGYAERGRRRPGQRRRRADRGGRERIRRGVSRCSGPRRLDRAHCAGRVRAQGLDARVVRAQCCDPVAGGLARHGHRRVRPPGASAWR